MCVGWPPLPLGRRLPGRVGATAGKRRRRRRSTRRMRKSSRRKKRKRSRRRRRKSKRRGWEDREQQWGCHPGPVCQISSLHVKILPTLQLSQIQNWHLSVSTVSSLSFWCVLFQNNRNNNIGRKEKKQKEKSACQNYLTHDSQIILDCRGPERGEGEDEEEKRKILSKKSKVK